MTTLHSDQQSSSFHTELVLHSRHSRFSVVGCVCRGETKGNNVRTEVDILHGLTFQTAEMVTKLADLARQSEGTGGRTSDPLARAALQQLSTAVEELRVTNEHLQAQVDQLIVAETEVESASAALEEFADAVPVATLWTDEAAQIIRVNEGAARLLNTTKDELQGKSLWLVTDREVLSQAMASLDPPVGRSSVALTVTVNPFDRPPRAVRLVGERLARSASYVWFMEG
jgi:PAS domain-containing protein